MSIAFGRDQLPRLDGVAARRGASRSELVREAVENLLARYERSPAGSGTPEMDIG
jgi:metal-responsive CopG/Arc/MetJ family transcriptional regulator